MSFFKQKYRIFEIARDLQRYKISFDIHNSVYSSAPSLSACAPLCLLWQQYWLRHSFIGNDILFRSFGKATLNGTQTFMPSWRKFVRFSRVWDQPIFFKMAHNTCWRPKTSDSENLCEINKSDVCNERFCSQHICQICESKISYQELFYFLQCHIYILDKFRWPRSSGVLGPLWQVDYFAGYARQGYASTIITWANYFNKANFLVAS